MKYIVFDIDGVLADCSHRLKYIQGEDKDYDKFYSDKEIMKDKPIEGGKKIMDMLYNSLCYGRFLSTNRILRTNKIRRVIR